MSWPARSRGHCESRCPGQSRIGWQAIEDADLCLFVFDSREGITPLDRIFADLLRRRDKPVVVVANKAEGKVGELGAADAFAVGLGDPIPISAEHGEGMSDLYDAVPLAYPAADNNYKAQPPLALSL